MLKKNKTQQTTFNDRKNIKTDINNEEKLAQKKTQQKMRKKRQATHKAHKKKTKLRNQQQRNTYYVKQTVKPREPPIYNAEMLKKTKRNKQHSTTEKNIKTDINNEEKLAQKKQRQKETISTEMLKNANRRQKQPDKAQKPPHTTNAKPATARQR